MSRLSPADIDGIKRMYRGAVPLVDIAAAHNTSLHLVRKALRSRNAPTRPHIPKSSGVSNETVQAMARRYEAGEGINAIARGYRMKNERVRAALVSHGVAIRPHGATKFDPATEARIAQRYAAGEAAARIGADVGCAYTTVIEIARRQGVRIQSVGGRRKVLTPDVVQKIARLWEAGESQTAIAQRFGVSQSAVSRSLIVAGFIPDRRIARREQVGSWQGGKHVAPDGYVRVLVDRTDPMAPMRNAMGYVPEHRLVMARHLGRLLSRSETVHHINGDKSDNRIENLQLRQRNHGNGVVYRCACCGSTNVVAVEIEGG